MNGIALLGLFFSPIPAAMAFLITYEEYSHHGLDRGAVVKHSAEAAVVAFVFFAPLALALSILLPAVVEGS